MLKTIKWLYRMGWEHNDRMIASKLNEFITIERANDSREQAECKADPKRKYNPIYAERANALWNAKQAIWPPDYMVELDLPAPTTTKEADNDK